MSIDPFAPIEHPKNPLMDRDLGNHVRMTVNDPCILHPGSRDGTGYGQAWDYSLKRIRRAHHLAYEKAYGPIPEGLVVDHICNVRHCINPNHLQAITQRENSLRGNPPRTHCPRGHEYNKVNTYIDPKGCKICRICKNESYRRMKQRKRTGEQQKYWGE